MHNPEQTGKETMVSTHQALGHEEMNASQLPCMYQRNECIVGHITHDNSMDQEDKGAGDGWGGSHGWACFSILGQDNSPSLCFNILLLWPYVYKEVSHLPYLQVPTVVREISVKSGMGDEPPSMSLEEMEQMQPSGGMVLSSTPFRCFLRSLWHGRDILFPLHLWVLSWGTCNKRQINEKNSLLTCIPLVHMGNTQELNE